MDHIPKFIGHRGAAGFAPENTLVAMRIGKKCGAQIVEFDVKQTRDGALVIMHDSDVQRTTNGQGMVKDMKLAELRSLDAGSWFDSSFAGEKVPTLNEIFQVLQELYLNANIEIKPCPGTDQILSKNVVNFVKNYWPHTLPPPIVSSFSIESLRTARSVNPYLQMGLILEQELREDWKLLAKELRVCVICLHHKSVTTELVKEMHKEGYAVFAYTVNDIARGHELYHMGIDSIFTNYPGMSFQ